MLIIKGEKTVAHSVLTEKAYVSLKGCVVCDLKGIAVHPVIVSYCDAQGEENSDLVNICPACLRVHSIQ